jgi:hypothetical protein
MVVNKRTRNYGNNESAYFSTLFSIGVIHLNHLVQKILKGDRQTRQKVKSFTKV